MIRQAIARSQAESARQELEEARRLDENGYVRDVSRLWLAQDRNWYWSLQLQASRLAENLK